MTEIIKLENVTKKFRLYHDGKRTFKELSLSTFQFKRNYSLLTSLDNISFSVNKGDFVGIIGPNGAGKTTLLRTVAQIIQPTVGRVLTKGKIVSLLEMGASFNYDLTMKDNIFLSGKVFGMTGNEIRKKLKHIVVFSELEDFLDVTVKHFSEGMKLRLAFSIIRWIDTDIYLLDEITAIGDEKFQNKCWEFFDTLKEKGKTIVFVSHDMRYVLKLSNKTILLDHGKMIMQGAPSETIKIYLNSVLGTKKDLVVKSKISKDKHSKISIEKVSFMNHVNKETTSFFSEKNMTIRLDYKALKEYKRLTFGIAIYDSEGNLLTGPNTTFANKIPKSVSKKGSVMYKVKRLPLTEGKYYVSASIYDESGTVALDIHDKEYSFLVVDKDVKSLGGIIKLDGDWSFK
ncbi:ABC transporter ATP-binding protein [archaeon]|nr:ABC transporter ATP-binding protein [archaeon]MBL7057356.1 ABC transporter ATP-binding protein [Candidatus Woesearchaeota archaeon]